MAVTISGVQGALTPAPKNKHYLPTIWGQI